MIEYAHSRRIRDLSDAHASLGFVLAIFDLGLGRSRAGVQAGHRAQPQQFGRARLRFDGVSLQGKHEEALSEAARARELDPVSGPVGLQFARVHFFSRQYDRAAQAFRAEVARLIDAARPPLHRTLLMTLYATMRGDA